MHVSFKTNQESLQGHEIKALYEFGDELFSFILGDPNFLTKEQRKTLIDKLKSQKLLLRHGIKKGEKTQYIKEKTTLYEVFKKW